MISVESRLPAERCQMRILKIIHGYPPWYNAGSEVYSQMLCQGLAQRHEVHVVTREEDPFREDFSWQTLPDPQEARVTLHRVNIPGEKYRNCYRQPLVDKQLGYLLQTFQPDIVHIGHLNHLSTSFVSCIAAQGIPIVYTLHDYWLMCPRGQFIQRNPAKKKAELWAFCDEQADRKCAVNCYAGYFSGAVDEQATDIAYWTTWVQRRMEHIREIIKQVDHFIAPSRYLYDRHVAAFALPDDKVTYLDYGFDLQRLTNRQRLPQQPFTFGYIGTHIPTKGIQHLIQAFGLLKGACQLHIWGRPRPHHTVGLQRIAATLPPEVQSRITWFPEYSNQQLVTAVLNQVDCVVVPSIWAENSPLVIHEALQVRLPVITADCGGMAEYVNHEVNGLLFKHRSVSSLAEQMQRLLDKPALAKKLGARGYLQSADGNIPNLTTHLAEIERLYLRLLH
ncbi:MAG: glycosyltransferase [Candidatus Symbiodolus clandestinus]